ncbi:unnamed protein product, partial [Rotaria sordida]
NGRLLKRFIATVHKDEYLENFAKVK